MSRGLRLLLVASLALNLLVAGLVVGALLRGGPPGPPRQIELSLGPLARALGPEDRDAIRERLRRDGAFDRPERAALRRDARALVDAIRAEPFDAGRLGAALEAASERIRSAQAAAHEAFVAHVAAMTPQARAALADRLDREMSGHRHHDGG